MRLFGLILLLLIPRNTWGYLPAAPELMDRMYSSHWTRANPVEIDIRLEDPGGDMGEDMTVLFPPADVTADDVDGFLPGAPSTNLLLALSTGPSAAERIFPSLFQADTPVDLSRVDRTVCYLIDGRNVRLWLRKEDYLPMRLDVLEGNGVWIASRFLEYVPVSGQLVYPSSTEVYRGAELLFLERLVLPPDRAHP